MGRRGGGSGRGGAGGAVVAPILVFCALLSWCGGKLGCSFVENANRDYREKQEALDRQIRADTERSEQAERERREKEEVRKQELARVDADERALEPTVRTERIRAVLPDVCAAKRLLAKATNPKVPDLGTARFLVSQAETKQLAAERPDFEKERMLSCGDKTTSSSCKCTGNHQGCCSHHRGVAGCEPYPTEVACDL